MTEYLMIPTKYILKELLISPFLFMKQLIPRGKRKQCPDDQPLPKVIIHVQGGLVQAVYSTEELDIQVYDLDISDFATGREIENAKTIAADFERQIQGFKQIY
jgi:hypothetical protein